MGRYVNSNLLKDEKVLYEAKIHWSFWVLPILSIVLMIVLALLCFKADTEDGAVWNYVGVVFLAIALFIFFKHLIEYKTTEVVVTSRRLVIKHGFIARTTFELLLQKAETVGVEQKLLGRILNFGRVTAIGTGGSHASAEYISRPMSFRSAFEEAVEAHKQVAPQG